MIKAQQLNFQRKQATTCVFQNLHFPTYNVPMNTMSTMKIIFVFFFLLFCSLNEAMVVSSPDFIQNDFNLALGRAKSEKKPLMIYFYGIWCPPCNILKETYFTSTPFLELSKKMVLLEMDSDLESSSKLKLNFKIKEYPTLIFTNSQGDEVNRIKGLPTKELFFSTLSSLIENKQISLVESIAKFDKKPTTETAWKLINYYYSKAEYAHALKYFSKAILAPHLTTQQRDLISLIPLLNLYEQDLINENLISALKNSIITFPKEITVLMKLDTLGNIAETTNDLALKKWTHEYGLVVSELNLKTQSSTSDFYFLKAESLAGLERNEESKKVYLETLVWIDSKIKKSTLDSKYNRGYNLEKAYALQKLGRFSEAHQIYQDLISKFPDEFTFYHNYSRSLFNEGKFQEALEQGQKALPLSYGDNKFKVSTHVIDVLIKLKKESEAKKLIQETLLILEQREIKSRRILNYIKKLTTLNSKLKN